MHDTRFPGRLFTLYVLFYACQALYGSYLNLYLNGLGFTKTQIGLTVSLATMALLLVQPVWGLVSDRARYKNSVLVLLFVTSAGVAWLFPQAKIHWMITGVVVLNALVLNPIAPLQDNLALETLENQKWDFGQIRMGGTIGYALMVLVVGLIINDDYVRIFPMLVVLLLLCAVSTLTLPKVKGHRRGGSRTPVRKIFKDPALLCLLFFFLAYSLGTSVFYTFYPIHFTTIGGDSGLVGVMLFVCAIAEVPFFFFAGKLVKRFGVYAMILTAGLVTTLRWFLLFMLTDPGLIILVGLTHGIGYVTVSYSMATHINTHAPRELRATAQSLIALIAAFFARIVFGYVGGVAADAFGVANLMLFSSMLTLFATGVFAIWFKVLQRRTAQPGLT